MFLVTNERVLENQLTARRSLIQYVQFKFCTTKESRITVAQEQRVFGLKRVSLGRGGDIFRAVGSNGQHDDRSTTRNAVRSMIESRIARARPRNEKKRRDSPGREGEMYSSVEAILPRTKQREVFPVAFLAIFRGLCGSTK